MTRCPHCGDLPHVYDGTASCARCYGETVPRDLWEAAVLLDTVPAAESGGDCRRLLAEYEAAQPCPTFGMWIESAEVDTVR